MTAITATEFCQLTTFDILQYRLSELEYARRHMTHSPPTWEDA